MPADDFRLAERQLSEAYVRLRALIPGAFDTPHAPTPEQIWKTTEDALRRLLTRVAKLEATIEGVSDALKLACAGRDETNAFMESVTDKLRAENTRRAQNAAAVVQGQDKGYAPIYQCPECEADITAGHKEGCSKLGGL